MITMQTNWSMLTSGTIQDSIRALKLTDIQHTATPKQKYVYIISWYLYNITKQKHNIRPPYYKKHM